ncbi:hypothetical protein [Streptacidiphilus cavernicola]|uniref:XRE family transcriptional regulator n=1 Tax=Streptacidiphilus cavernicola TaxID=3342716 RepID=A0ABV6W248_9ACTN
MTDTPKTLAEKVDLLVRLASPPDHRLTMAELAKMSVEADPADAGLSHTSWNDLLRGAKTDPRLSTLLVIARTFDIPDAYLLPSCDNLTALSALHSSPKLRAAVTAVADLGDEGASALLEAAQTIRHRMGAGPPPPAAPSTAGTAPARRRRAKRLPWDQVGQRAERDLEGKQS